jgi:glycine oxidase
MLAPLAESAITEMNVVGMGVYGLKRWPELLAQLDQSVFFQQAGTLVVWHRQDATLAMHFSDKLAQTQKHLPASDAYIEVDSSGLHQLEPMLAATFHQGMFLPSEGQLDNRQLLDALMHQLQNSEVQIHFENAVSPEQFTQADWVIDCRGTGARGDWSALRGVRGEVLRVHAPDVKLSRPVRLIHPRYPLYIAPKPDGVFVIGATEIESDDTSPASVRSSLELLSAAYSIHKGFGEARILEISAQIRPTLPDNLPAIRLRGHRHMQINGLYRHGFLIAPAMLDASLALMSGNKQTAQSLGIRLVEEDE